jgi:hypothetical protein
MKMLVKIEAARRALNETKRLAEFRHADGLQQHPNPYLDWKRSPLEE